MKPATRDQLAADVAALAEQAEAYLHERRVCDHFEPFGKNARRCRFCMRGLADHLLHDAIRTLDATLAELRSRR